MLTYQDDDFEDLLGDEETDDPPSEAIPGLATESEMAQLLGITANRVRTLARDGMLHRPVRGRYDVRASLKTYIGDLRDKASRLGYAGGKQSSNSQLSAEKLRLTKAQVDEREIKNAAARGELIPAQKVRTAWTSYTIALRQAVLAAAPRVATQAGLDRAAAATLDAELRLALEQIADKRTVNDG
ncbi:hypothetical protein ACG74X_00145 [Marivita sp. S0852]|uniref:hypothetical protein n=1 Tax=Marivita sp. S0852 TaxID=3373893 RepID=UPI003981F0DE